MPGRTQLDAMPFEVSFDREQDYPVIRVRGELDFATGPVLQDALQEALGTGAQHLVLDFKEVTFLDSEGIKVLLQAYKDFRERGGSMTVRRCSRCAARTFEILGLDGRFGIDREEAENSEQAL